MVTVRMFDCQLVELHVHVGLLNRFSQIGHSRAAFCLCTRTDVSRDVYLERAMGTNPRIQPID